MELMRIEEETVVKAPVSRVWRAISDHKEFGEWFRIEFSEPFVVGKTLSGRLLFEGMERVHFEIKIVAVEVGHRFAFTWHPHAVDPDFDYSKEEPTLVEFSLSEVPGGTRVSVVESGFEKVPSARRIEAFKMNHEGWKEQMENLAAYVG